MTTKLIEINKTYDIGFACECRNYGTKMGHLYGAWGYWKAFEDMDYEEKVRAINLAWENVGGRGKICDTCGKEIHMV